MIRFAFLVSLMGFSLQSCSMKDGEDYRYSERHFFDAVTGKDTYSKIWEKNSKTKHAYSSFEAQMRAEVTHWDLPLREAYINKMKNVYRLPAAEEQALRLQEYRENENYIVFIVSLTTRFLKHNDLDRPNSVYRVVLEDMNSKTQVQPSRVEKISDKNERLKFFYRNMSNFSETYRVSFPKKKFLNEAQVKLFLTGPVGRAFFIYPLERNKEPVAQLDSQSATRHP